MRIPLLSGEATLLSEPLRGFGLVFFSRIGEEANLSTNFISF
jgi:hypothetical protein